MQTSAHISPVEVRALRLSARMTQDAFGALVNVSGRQVRKWESDGGQGCPAEKFEMLRGKLAGSQRSGAYITGRVFGLLDLADPLGSAELAQCDIYPAKYFALAYRKRRLSAQYDAALAALLEDLDSFPDGPMSDEQKSHFWLGWHHQRRDMRTGGAGAAGANGA
jgi:transcriptional regulator with XRE-family HTH domain